MTFLFDTNPVSYLLKHPGGASRLLTMVGRHAVLDGERCDESTCHHSNKILAKFGSSEVALQFFPDQLGGTGVIRTKDVSGAADIVTPVVAVAEPILTASIDMQKADKTWIEKWATLVVSPDENGQPQATIAMSNKPAEQIPVATIGGQGEPLGFMVFLGSAVTTNGGYLEGKLSMSGLELQGEMYLQVPNPEYDPNVRGSLRFNYITVAARAKWNSSVSDNKTVAALV